MQPDYHEWPLPAAELKPALELALAVAHADMGVLMLHDDKVGALFPALGVGITDEQCLSIGSHRAGIGPFGTALAEHRRVIVPDAWVDSDSLPDLAHHLGYHGLEVLPLFAPEGPPIGALVVMFRHRRASDRHGHDRIQQCARLVIAAVLQARLRSTADHARDAAEEIGRAKVQFLARMSHELRTPLQSIAGYTELLRSGSAHSLTDPQTKMLDRIRDNERILVTAINDLITYAHLEAGHITYRLTPTAADDALRIAEAVVVPLAEDRGVHVTVTPVSDHAIVTGDAEKLKQILVNLAANAVKFTKRGGLVTLACRVEPEHIYFDVSGSGPGIAASDLNGIFKPYGQLSALAFDQSGGSGLGLAISHDFAVGMKGTLTVRNVAGAGSVFTLRLARAVAS